MSKEAMSDLKTADALDYYGEYYLCFLSDLLLNNVTVVMLRLAYSDSMLKEALEEDVAFLVVGDPLGATTHSDLILRAKAMGVKIQVIGFLLLIMFSLCRLAGSFLYCFVFSLR